VEGKYYQVTKEKVIIITAVLCRFSQYIAWITQESIPYPVTRDKWDVFTNFTCKFYSDLLIKEKVNHLYKNHIRTVQTRRNTINGKIYNQDPVIMSKKNYPPFFFLFALYSSYDYIYTIGWQIANEPQLAPKDWFEDIAYFIKQGSPHQLVSTGIESKFDEIDFLNAHESSNIDYCTCHLWVEK
jgi:mannan endo-1,4-beta-mannosidase